MLEEFKTYPNIDHCLKILSQNHWFAAAISREHARNNDLISFSQLHCFDQTEVIYEYALKFLVNKNFSYLTELNTFIRRASASGLIEKWHKSYSNRTFYKQKPNHFTQLRVNNLQGVFSLLFLFIMTHCSALLLEMFIHKKANEINSFRFYKIIELIIDPDRHFLLVNQMP